MQISAVVTGWMDGFNIFLSVFFVHFGELTNLFSFAHLGLSTWSFPGVVAPFALTRALASSLSAAKKAQNTVGGAEKLWLPKTIHFWKPNTGEKK